MLLSFKQILLISVLLIKLAVVLGQEQTLTVTISDGSELTAKLKRELGGTKSFKNELALSNHFKNSLRLLYSKGYLAASYDSISQDSTNVRALLSPGKVYHWAQIRKGNADEEPLSKTGFREKVYQDIPVSYAQVTRLTEKLLDYYENHGYPFASVKLDSLIFRNDSISASLNVQKHSYIKIDSVIIKGDAKISPVYVYNYLDISPGDPYNEETVRKVDTRIRELPFLKEIKPSEISFTKDNAELYLFLEKKNASQFDGLIGFLPDNETGKILLTGQAHLKLHSSFGRGEMLDINWRKLQARTQDLNVYLLYPFLFRTNFGVEGTFSLYKRDTLFLELERVLGIQYHLGKNNYLEAFINNKQSTVLTDQLQTTGFNDVNMNLYGLGIRAQQLDYLLNPRKGYRINARAKAGNKKISSISDTPDTNNGEDQSTIQSQYSFLGELYLPIGRRGVTLLRNNSALMKSSRLFSNELFRIGGIRTLRGFDEESINASLYSIFTLEYRFLLEQNSFLYLFADGAYYRNQATSPVIEDTPFGFGAGVSFETQAGIFTINYALGKQFDNPIQFRSAKIHFGIVNYF